MNNAAWEDLREEVCTHLEMGTVRGETELDIMTRLIWLERQSHLEAVEKAVAAALSCEPAVPTRKGKVLQWKQPSRSAGLSCS